MQRTNRAIRLSDEEWKNFRDFIGMERLRKLIDKAAKKANRPAVGATEPEKE